MDLFICLLKTVKSCFYLVKFTVVKVFIFLFYLSHIMCFESDELHFTLNISFPSFFYIIFTYFKYNPQLCLFSTRYVA